MEVIAEVETIFKYLVVTKIRGANLTAKGTW